MGIKCLMNGLEVNYPCSPVCSLFGDCVTAFESQKKASVRTNADRIRAMSDEELAKLIVKHKPLYSWCKGVREIWMKPNVTKVQAWLEWLKQPAEGGTQ